MPLSVDISDTSPVLTAPRRSSKSGKASHKTITRATIQDLYRNDVALVEPYYRRKGRENLHSSVVDYLSEVEHPVKLPQQYLEILQQSVRRDPQWDPVAAKNAFQQLEKYALNLLDKPWKHEYRTVKVGLQGVQGPISHRVNELIIQIS